MQGPLIISFDRLRPPLRRAAGPIDLETRGAFELVFGKAVLVGVDRELSRLVVAAGLDAGHQSTRFAFADLLDQQVVDRALAVGRGRSVHSKAAAPIPLKMSARP